MIWIQRKMHCYKMDFPITYITNKDAHNLWIGTINGIVSVQ